MEVVRASRQLFCKLSKTVLEMGYGDGGRSLLAELGY